MRCIVKINEINKINVLNEMCRILLNKKYNDRKYDYYFLNDITWLINKKEKIEKDFDDLYNSESIDFDILLNTDYIKNYTDYYWQSLMKLDNDIDLFGSCINGYYTTYGKTRELLITLSKNTINYKDIDKEVQEKHKKFVSIKNKYFKKDYFEEIKRK